MSEITIPMDSAYVGFIFLVITEFFLMHVIVKSQIRSMDREVKRCLDNGEHIDLNVKEYGPLKMVSTLGLKKIVILIFPAVFVLCMVSFGELGISGRTVGTYSKQSVIKAGGYFQLDSVRSGPFVDGVTPTNLSPLRFTGVRNKCIDYISNTEIKASRLAMTLSSPPEVECLEDYITVSTLEPTIVYTIEYNITETGEMIYEQLDKLPIFGSLGDHRDLRIFSGKCVAQFGGIKDGLSRSVYFLEHRIEDGFTYNDVIIDVSERADGTKWAIDVARGYPVETGSISQYDIRIDCVNCLEALVEWAFNINPEEYDHIDIDTVDTFLSIWYEGLDWLSTGPVCDNNSTSGWLSDHKEEAFRAGCDDAVGIDLFPDGGFENVTVVSYWAICFVVIGFFISFIYHFYTLHGGYDLLSYEGVSKVCYEDTNPGHIWRKGDYLKVCLVDGRVSSKV